MKISSLFRFLQQNIGVVLPVFLMCAQADLRADNQPNKMNRSRNDEKCLREYCYTENKGQVRDQFGNARPDVLYSGVAGELVYHLKPDGISYQLYNYRQESTGIYRLDISWLNCNRYSQTRTKNELRGFDNFYFSHLDQPVNGIKSFGDVIYENLYDNIDLHYYQKNGHLKYDFIVKPGANYKSIRLHISGSTGIAARPDGSLLLKTPFGDILEGAPIVYQGYKSIGAKWQITGDTLSFVIDDYDYTLPLVIDPATRAWGTYYGGTGQFGITVGNSCRVDAAGNVYLAGSTDANSGSSIATSGAHQTNFSGSLDAFIVKFDSTGVRQWGTYYGGTSNDNGNSCAVDAAGNVYLAGLTSSSSSIATIGSHQPALGGQGDGFLVKFASNGMLVWATYFGGSDFDQFTGCAIDGSGDIIVVGSTKSSSGIASPGSHQASYGGNSSYDGLVVKFNTMGFLQWSTYYGHTGDDFASSVSVDNSANIFVVGQTSVSSNGIATPSSHQSSNGGGNDGFLVKFNAAGVRQWATYYGGSGSDNISSCIADNNGDVYVIGKTSSSNGISTTGSHQVTNGGGSSDAFLVKFNGSGTRLWGTYYGDNGNDLSGRVNIDFSGNVFITGNTNSGASIATPGSHQTVLGGGNSDGFLVKFNGSGTRIWGTFYGGSGNDAASDCVTTPAGKIYLSGSTSSGSGTVIATVGSHQSIYAGSNNAFLVQFTDCTGPAPPVNSTSASNLTLCSNSTTTLNATAGGTIDWYATSTSTAVLNTGGTFVTQVLSSGIYTFYAATTNTCSSSGRTAISVTVNPLIGVNSGSICTGQSFTLVPSGVTSFTFSNGNSVVSPTVNSTYTVTGTDQSGCTGSAVSSVIVHPQPIISVNNGTLCSGNSFTILPTGAATYTFIGGGPIVSPVTNASYTITGTSAQGCTAASIAVSNVTVISSPTVLAQSSKTMICKGEVVKITVSGAVTYSWSNGSTGTQVAVTPTVTTTYTITGTAANSCSFATTITQSVKVCTHLRQLSEIPPEILILPNPNHGIFNVALTQAVDDMATLEIFNALGQFLGRENLFGQGATIDLSHRPAGIYILSICKGGTVIGYSRVIVQ